MKSVKRSLLAIGVTVGLAASFSGWSWAHERALQTKEGASIVVDGVVREVFRSPRQNQTDLVVQIEVARSEYGRAPADPRRVQCRLREIRFTSTSFRQALIHNGPPEEGTTRFLPSAARSGPISTLGIRGAGKGHSPTGSTRPGPHSSTGVPVIRSLLTRLRPPHYQHPHYQHPRQLRLPQVPPRPPPDRFFKSWAFARASPGQWSPGAQGDRPGARRTGCQGRY